MLQSKQIKSKQLQSIQTKNKQFQSKQTKNKQLQPKQTKNKQMQSKQIKHKQLHKTNQKPTLAIKTKQNTQLRYSYRTCPHSITGREKNAQPQPVPPIYLTSDKRGLLPTPVCPQLRNSKGKEDIVKLDGAGAM